ncbi:hypothetical protein STAIW_v1c01430 [Spiroplasma taiwanense CT-1]|uniref:Uncharacterized protein n=1 Tax=Spiroplasma taiwanense CT-1 TaxID=1276220 RepID=S5LT16_9MOLU|nr:hypothetical protein STAIW_v1c01430 [Spiroplasma taiwanense CT-1]
MDSNFEMLSTENENFTKNINLKIDQITKKIVNLNELLDYHKVFLI